MNRELKFRVWDIVNRQFFPQEVLTKLPLDIFLASEYIQQYTGLKDKNHNPVYEGDIVQFHSSDKNHITASIVEWENYGFALMDIFYRKSIPLLYIDGMEVIGNIFQPPCKPDHNGECLVCDNWLSDCEFASDK